MKKKLLALAMMAVVLTGLTGCGEMEISADKDTVFILKKGEIKGLNTASFDKEYYDSAELEAFINEEVDTYVAENGTGSVQVSSFEVADQVATLVLDYTTPSDYAGFNGVDFYSGTVIEAQAAGYEFDVPFLTVTDGVVGEKTDKTTVLAEGDKKIVVIAENTDVKVEGKILYVSENVTVNDRSWASVSYDSMAADAKEAYIIYK